MKRIHIYSNVDVDQLIDFCSTIRGAAQIYDKKVFFKYTSSTNQTPSDINTEVIIEDQTGIPENIDTTYDFTIVLTNDIVNIDGARVINPLDSRVAKDLFHFFNSFVFIVSPRGSGSTFLRHALNKHQSLCSHKADVLNPVFDSNLMDFIQDDIRYTNYIDSISSMDIYEYIDMVSKQILIDYHYPNGDRDDFYKNYVPNNTCIDSSRFNLINIERLNNAMLDKKYIFLVRNPYAIAQEIYRMQTLLKNHKPNTDNSWQGIGECVLKLFELQYEAVQKYSGLLIKYEDMTDTPEVISSQLNDFLDISGVDLSSINKPIYNIESWGVDIHNFNNEDISNIPAEGLSILQSVFETKQYIFNYFGYQLGA